MAEKGLALHYKVIAYQNKMATGSQEIKSIQLTGLGSKCIDLSFEAWCRPGARQTANKHSTALETHDREAQSDFSVAAERGQLQTDGEWDFKRGY